MSVKELSQPDDDDRDGISFSEKRIRQRAFIAAKKKTVLELLKRH